MRDFGQVMRDGKYYYPANLRYEEEPFEGVVHCDACDYDLCMSCMRAAVSIDERIRRRQMAQELDDS